MEDPPLTSKEAPKQNGVPKIFVVDALLELTLAVPSIQAFDARLAACECIKAYFYNHHPIRQYFLGRAIDVYSLGEDEGANVLSTLLNPVVTGRSTDPYRIWFASVIMLHLLYEDSDVKSHAMKVSEGDADSGEEVVTCIQSLTGNLIRGMQKGEDERVSIAYLMLLCGWLYEDPDAVNDFLGEGSSFQSLVQAVTQGQIESTIVQGLCAVLLGIIYEFSTKDSPVPRATLHPILASRMGREQYIDKITRLREQPLLRDFEVIPQGLDSRHGSGLPEVFFDKTFVDFLKDNSSRLIRAIDRDPGMEVPVIANGIQKGISRELVDSLRTQLDDKNQSLQKAEGDLLTLERKLGQEQADNRRAKETAALESARTRTINESLQKHHDEEVQELRKEHDRNIDTVQRQHRVAMTTVEGQLEQLRKEADEHAAKMQARHGEEISDLRLSIQNLELTLEKTNRDHLQDLTTAHEDHTSKTSILEGRLKRAEERADEAEHLLKRAEERVKLVDAKALQSSKALEEKEEARNTVQTELDDLLMVLGDIEEKRARDKVCLGNWPFSTTILTCS